MSSADPGPGPLPVAERTIRTVATALGDVEYASLGEGLPVLVVHGSPGGHDVGTAMARFLVPHGRRPGGGAVLVGRRAVVLPAGRPAPGAGERAGDDGGGQPQVSVRGGAGRRASGDGHRPRSVDAGADGRTHAGAAD